MDTLFNLDTIEPVKTVIPKARRPLDIFICVASWKGEWWKIYRETFSTQEAAENFLRTLDAGWIERKIFHLTA